MIELKAAHEMADAKPNQAVFAPCLEEYDQKTELVQSVILEVDTILAYLVKGDDKVLCKHR